MRDAGRHVRHRRNGGLLSRRGVRRWTVHRFHVRHGRRPLLRTDAVLCRVLVRVGWHVCRDDDVRRRRCALRLGHRMLCGPDVRCDRHMRRDDGMRRFGRDVRSDDTVLHRAHVWSDRPMLGHHLVRNGGRDLWYRGERDVLHGTQLRRRSVQCGDVRDGRGALLGTQPMLHGIHLRKHGPVRSNDGLRDARRNVRRRDAGVLHGLDVPDGRWDQRLLLVDLTSRADESDTGPMNRIPGR